MPNRKLLFVILFSLTAGYSAFTDTGSGESAAGSLTSMPPSAPDLDSPADGATDVLSSDVAWDATSHAATYRLQVSTVSDFTSTVADETGLTGTDHTVSGLSGSTQYFWHVSATNVAGTGDYSETWDFTTDASLSVRLSAFSAEYHINRILIQWITESETNNLGFILERSTLSESGWDEIASYETHQELAGQGNSSSRTPYAYTDLNVEPGLVYQYRLSDVDTHGEIHIYDVIQVSMPDTPELTALDPPAPNPFNPQTRITYQLAETGPVAITLFDIMGRRVTTLVNEEQPAGSYHIYWHGQDSNGNQMASGTYLIILQTASEVKKQKAILLH